ncbi:MAG: antitoxin [Alphaproteobacteria bacterium]
MDFVTLRRAGGSLVLTIPKTHVRALGLAEGARIGVSVDAGKLVADPSARPTPRFRLEDLIAQCDPKAPLSKEDEAWLNDQPAGGEFI